MSNENKTFSIMKEINDADNNDQQTIDNKRLYEELLASAAEEIDSNRFNHVGEVIPNEKQQSSTDLTQLPFTSILKKEESNDPAQRDRSSSSRGVMLTSPLSGTIRNSDPINFKTLLKSRDENIRKQAMSIVLIFIDDYNRNLNHLLPSIKKYIYFFYPNEEPANRGMKHIGVLLEKYDIYPETEWVKLAKKMLDDYDNDETGRITMKDIFKSTNVLLSKNMMNELFTYPYGFTKDQINRFNETNIDTTIPSHVYVRDQDTTPSTITKDGLSSSSISSSDSNSSGSSGGGGKVPQLQRVINQETIDYDKQFILDLEKAIQLSSQDTFYTAQGTKRKKEDTSPSISSIDDKSILDESSDTYYRGRELKHDNMIRDLIKLKDELQVLKDKQSGKISSSSKDSGPVLNENIRILENKITKLQNEIRLLEQSLNSPSTQPSPPSWMSIESDVTYEPEKHDQLFETNKSIEELRDLLANERDEDRRVLYYGQIKSLEETRNEIFDNYLNSQNTKSGGKKTKKLRNTKKKRRNKRKKSRKNKK